MVAPAIIGALIGAGSSLLGGLADRKQRNKELRMQDPQYIRDRFEAAGFNPLLGIGNALGGLGYAPTMGSAMSDAGSMIAQGITASEQQKIQLAELDLENRRLEQQLRLATLSPRFPGVYGSRNANAPSAVHVSSGRPILGDPFAGTPAAGPFSFGATVGVAPGRDVEALPYASGPGLTEINNAYTDVLGGPIVVPGDDGEPWGIDEVATASLAGVAQGAARVGDIARDLDPRRTNTGITREQSQQIAEAYRRNQVERRAGYGYRPSAAYRETQDPLGVRGAWPFGSPYPYLN